MSQKKHGKRTDTEREVAPDDADLFRRHLADARELDFEVPVPKPRKVVPQARFRRADEQSVLEESMQADVEETETNGGDSLRFHRSHVGRRTMRKLARGGYSVQAEVDLHGMTAKEAAAALRDFVNESLRRGHTCVRIIHGKGLGSGARGPVLKGKVNRWLRRWDEVLAFVSARQVDGGTGAIYVLLRSRS
jgi:DNA-nicking Smr family endonuclease